MIKVLRVTVQHAPLDNDPKEWIMDLVATYVDGANKHESWNSVSMEGCLQGLPLIIERLNKQEAYA